MRTATSKQVEYMTFSKMSTLSIVMGASKELYRRYSTEVWAVLAFGELAVIIFIKLGK